MPPPANSPANSIPAIYQVFAALSRTIEPDEQSGLGGKLLYAGEINDLSRSLLYAANIAGAASLAASPDPATQRQTIRDGVVDFLVTSLEEALRILKNEIRKHQTVSVAVATSSETLTAQMLDRGVLPYLLAALPSDQAKTFLSQGAREIAAPGQPREEFVSWSVDRNPARWLPRLDICAQAIVPANDHPRQRWLRLAPRYLGRLAQRQHGIALAAGELARFEVEVNRMLERNRIESGETAQVTIAAISPENAHLM
jgi:urocanate hydratase